MLHDGRRIEEGVLTGVEGIAQRFDLHARRPAADLFGSFVFLQRDQADTRQPGEALELGQGGVSSHPALRWVALPGDPDLETGFANDMSPLFYPAGFGRKVRYVVRNGLQRRLECQGQAQQRAMVIELGECRAILDELHLAAESRQQGTERSLRHEEDVGTEFTEERNEPRELNRVPKSLLPVHKNSPFRNGCIAEPERLV